MLIWRNGGRSRPLGILSPHHAWSSLRECVKNGCLINGCVTNGGVIKLPHGNPTFQYPAGHRRTGAGTAGTGCPRWACSPAISSGGGSCAKASTCAISRRLFTSIRSKWPCPNGKPRRPAARVANRAAWRPSCTASRRSKCPRPGDEPLGERPVVVGSGPAGVFAAYFLAEQGYRPLVLERGQAVRERIADVRAFDAGGPHDPESNYLFGEGGAGTFSDGKLTCRSSGPDVPPRAGDVRRVQRASRRSSTTTARTWAATACRPWSRRCGSGSSSMGGEFRFDCRVEDLDLADGAVRGLATSSGYVPTPLVRAGHRPQRPRHV